MPAAELIAKYVGYVLIGSVAGATFSIDLTNAQSGSILETVANSHVDGNVPAASDFDTLLKRDLETYFSQKSGKNIAVQYQALRDSPTQSGVAFPKFYFWVTVREAASKDKLAEGAVRVAAVNKSSFDVTDFVSIEAIRKRPDILRTIFPLAVIERISDHVH
jgi:hypothetical protein